MQGGFLYKIWLQKLFLINIFGLDRSWDPECALDNWSKSWKKSVPWIIGPSPGIKSLPWITGPSPGIKVCLG